MNIFLLGYRGSGKTSVGKQLANHLWKDFVDTDDEVCKRFGIDSIATIWEEHGEPAFRKMECDVTADLCTKDDLVVGLGGGTVMQPDARKSLEAAENATKIYLFCQPETLLERIEADPQSGQSRPSLTGHNSHLDEIKAVLEERDPVYRAVADHVFDVTHLPLADVAGYLMRQCL